MNLWCCDWSVSRQRWIFGTVIGLYLAKHSWIFGTVIGLYLGTDGSLVL